MQLRNRSAAVLAAMVVIAGGTMLAQRANLGDLRQAANIEIRDGGGTVVISGVFKDDDDDDDDADKEAKLTGSGNARGEADIDIDDDNQELEVEVHGLAPNETFSVWIDGRQVGSFTTNERGRADVEWHSE